MSINPPFGVRLLPRRSGFKPVRAFYVADPSIFLINEDTGEWDSADPVFTHILGTPRDWERDRRVRLFLVFPEMSNAELNGFCLIAALIRYSNFVGASVSLGTRRRVVSKIREHTVFDYVDSHLVMFNSHFSSDRGNHLEVQLFTRDFFEGPNRNPWAELYYCAGLYAMNQSYSDDVDGVLAGGVYHYRDLEFNTMTVVRRTGPYTIKAVDYYVHKAVRGY